MKRKILFTILIIIIGGIATGIYLLNKPRQSIMDSKPVAILNSEELVMEFESDESKSNNLYLGKVIEVSGIVDQISTDELGVLNITLRGGDLAGVGCQFEKSKDSDSAKPKIGDNLTVKGICTGILMDVVLVDCVIVK